jgi:hypothetical protein
MTLNPVCWLFLIRYRVHGLCVSSILQPQLVFRRHKFKEKEAPTTHPGYDDFTDGMIVFHVRGPRRYGCKASRFDLGVAQEKSWGLSSPVCRIGCVTVGSSTAVWGDPLASS